MNKVSDLRYFYISLSTPFWGMVPSQGRMFEMLKISFAQLEKNVCMWLVVHQDRTRIVR